MEYRKFDNRIVARFDKGEEIITQVKTICEKEDIQLAGIYALGAVSEAELGCFDTSEKKYYANQYQGIYEIASLVGNASRMDGKVYLHIHSVLAGKDNKTIGGHLSRAVVSATCEMVIDIVNGAAGRFFSDKIGLNLLSFC